MELIIKIFYYKVFYSFEGFQSLISLILHNSLRSLGQTLIFLISQMRKLKQLPQLMQITGGQFELRFMIPTPESLLFSPMAPIRSHVQACHSFFFLFFLLPQLFPLSFSFSLFCLFSPSCFFFFPIPPPPPLLPRLPPPLSFILLLIIRTFFTHRKGFVITRRKYNI